MFTRSSHEDLKLFSNRDQVKLAFGLRQGQILHISEVSRGKNCACICPACERPLVAHKGNSRPGGRRHHFKHLPDASAFYCAGNQEGAIHQFAKQCLEKHRVLTLPPVKRQHIESAPQRVVSLNTIVFEQAVTRARYRPDATAYGDTSPLLIEFENTHPVGPEKIAKIIADNLPAVEIKLLGWFGERKSLTIDSEDLVDWILHRAHRTWLWHPDFHQIEAALAEEERRAAERDAQRLAEERQHQQELAILRQETARRLAEQRQRSSDDLLKDIEHRHSSRLGTIRLVPPPQVGRRPHMTDARLRDLLGRAVPGTDFFRRPAVIWQKEFIDYCYRFCSAPITISGFLGFLAGPTRMWIASEDLNHSGLIEAVRSYAQILAQEDILFQDADGTSYRLSLTAS
jgi:hypothetical protein